MCGCRRPLQYWATLSCAPSPPTLGLSDPLTPFLCRQQELFQSVFGGQTTSNNTSWMRGKLKAALGLAGKKPRAAGAPSRKR